MSIFGFKKEKTAAQIAAEQDEQYQKGKEAYQNKDYQTAYQIWQDLGNQGHADAMTALGISYVRGEGVEQNYELAYQWYQKAVDLDHTRAMNNLALLYRDGNYVKKDIQTAIQLFEKAANKGYLLSKRNLGKMYLYGTDVPVDLKKACEWLESAVNEDDTWAMYYLSELYAKKESSYFNPTKAFKLCQKAATKGHLLSITKTATYLLNGFGVDKNLDKALQYALQAANSGDDEATKLIEQIDALLLEKSQKIEAEREKLKEKAQISNDGQIIMLENIQTVLYRQLFCNDYIFLNQQIYKVVSMCQVPSNPRLAPRADFILENIYTKEKITINKALPQRVEKIIDIHQIISI